MPAYLKRILFWLTKPQLLHWLLPYLMAQVALGTVLQKYIGLYLSQQLVFSSYILWLGWVPLPGMRIAVGLLLLCLLAKLILASPWHRKTSGIFIAHLGVALLLAGGLLTASSSVEGFMELAPKQSSSLFKDSEPPHTVYHLPFQVRLDEAEKELHPGTVIPSSYRSVVTVIDGEFQQKMEITMNHPMRYRGYTLYQASFDNQEDVTRSVRFEVVHNIGRVFPYVASTTLCIGLLIHLFLRLPILLRRRA